MDNPKAAMLAYGRERIAWLTDHDEHVPPHALADEWLASMDDAERDEVLRTLGLMTVRGTMYDLMRGEVAKTRRIKPGRRLGPRTFGDSMQRVDSMAGTWGRWLENIGGGLYRPLLAMTADELRTAADIRKRRGERDLHLGLFFDRLAERVAVYGAEAQVRDAWSEEELTRELDGMKIDVTVTWEDVLGDGLRLVAD